ncbi:MAG: NAD(P)/FAD-dependent oxidoreductase [Halobacteria archaeon]
MRTLEYDVLVVGAGPSGSSAARYAAQGGARTLMIEKRQEIGSPVRCGEGLSKSVLDEVKIPRSNKWVANEVAGARIFSPNGACMKLRAEQAGNEVGIVLERDAFDKALAELAVRAGTDLLVKTSATSILKSNGHVEGVRAVVQGEPVEIRARLTIGADGFESQIGRWAGLNTLLKTRDVDATLQYRLANIECDADFCDFYLGNEVAPGGYVWVFPKGEDVANVGIGVQLSQTRQKADTRYYLDRFIAEHPGIARGRPLDMVCGAVSTCKPLSKTVTDGLMLVGDAARMIDPITGGGIANGCLAGMFAGQVANEALQAGDFSGAFLQRYEKAWRSRLERLLTRNWMAKEKFGKLSDDTLNKVIETLSEVHMDEINTLNLLKAVQSKHPELLRELNELMAA